MLEMSPEKKNLAIAHVLFYKGLKAVKGDESRIHVVNGKKSSKVLQEKDGLSSWKLLQEFVQSSARPFFEAVVYSS